MRHRHLKPIAFAATLLVVVVGSLAARWRLAAPPPAVESPPPILVIDSRALDFGDAWASGRVEWKLPIRNVSDSEATLVSLLGNCSCVSMKPLPLRIEAGGTAVLHLELDLTNWCAADPDDIQQYRINLVGTVRTTEGDRPVGWVLEGRTKHAARPNPRMVDFGRVWPPQLPAERSVDIRPSLQVGPVRAEVIDDSTGGVTAEVRSTPEGSQLFVRLNRAVVPGRYRCAVRLSSTTVDGASVPGVLLPVEWDVLGEVQPDTPEVALGPQPVGSVHEQTVVFTSLADRSFRITGASGGDGTRVEVPSPGPGSSLAVRVIQRIERTGDQTAEFTVSGTTAAGEEFRVRFRVLYYGLNPSTP